MVKYFEAAGSNGTCCNVQILFNCMGGGKPEQLQVMESIQGTLTFVHVACEL